MRVGDLVKWSDPGKSDIGIVIRVPAARYLPRDERIDVSWFGRLGGQVTHPLLYKIELVEPRKVDESR